MVFWNINGNSCKNNIARLHMHKCKLQERKNMHYKAICKQRFEILLFKVVNIWRSLYSGRLKVRKRHIINSLRAGKKHTNVPDVHTSMWYSRVYVYLQYTSVCERSKHKHVSTRNRISETVVNVLIHGGGMYTWSGHKILLIIYIYIL